MRFDITNINKRSVIYVIRLPCSSMTVPCVCVVCCVNCFVCLQTVSLKKDLEATVSAPITSPPLKLSQRKVPLYHNTLMDIVLLNTV